MNVLFVSNTYPWPLDNGAIQRVYYIADAIARRHRLTFVAQTGLAETAAPKTPLHDRCASFHLVNIQAMLNRRGGPYGLWRSPAQRLRSLAPGQLPALVSRWWSEETVQYLSGLREHNDFDLVWCVRAPVAEAARAAGYHSIVVDLPDLESQGLEREINALGKLRQLHRLDLKRLQRYERTLPSRFAHAVVCKEDDRHFLGLDQRNVSVVANGVQISPPVDSARSEPGSLLFVGSMGYPPNIEAVTDFVRSTLPLIRQTRSDAKFRIVGKEPGAEIRGLDDGDSCAVVGPVPDVRPYYEQASVVVAPIKSGAGTRIKILEALMFGRALVATPTAVEGLDLRPGIDFEPATSAAEFSRACTDLLGDPGRRLHLIENGRARVVELYSWDRIADSVEAALQRVADTAGALRGRVEA